MRQCIASHAELTARDVCPVRAVPCRPDACAGGRARSQPELERIAGDLVSRSEAVRMRMGAMSSSAPDTMKSIDRKALNDELQSELFDKLNDALQDSLTRAMTSSNAAKKGARGRTIKQKIDMKTMAVYLPLIRENEKKAAEERLSQE